MSACVTIDDKTLADLSYFEPPRTGAPVADIRVLKETILVLRRFWILTLAAILLAGAGLTSVRGASAPQKKDGTPPTAEQVAETVVLVFGVRERLVQIRRTGVERGRITRTTDDGRTEEITYERSFKRGDTLEKDKVRLDQRRPTLDYSLILNEGRVFGVVRGTTFTPRQEDVNVFLADTQHGIETLLRYKESGATLSFAGKDKQKGIDLWMLDLDDKEKRRTRFYISASTGRILWLEYNETPAGTTVPVKYKRTFHDYRIVQGTRVPYRTVLYMDDKQIEESQVMSVVYGVKMEDTVFRNPESSS
ncbi:MAG: hypothetical protein H0T60_03090 [Acidobacteria bacterium]|nr:hypothetical protein [Acidobacteriota bacterium]